MIKPSPQVLERLAQIKGDKILTDWLTAGLEAYRDDAVMQRDDITLRVVQGKAQGLKELLEMIQQSPDILEKYRRA